MTKDNLATMAAHTTLKNGIQASPFNQLLNNTYDICR
jgi:hypothetical protein